MITTKLSNGSEAKTFGSWEAKTKTHTYHFQKISEDTFYIGKKLNKENAKTIMWFIPLKELKNAVNGVEWMNKAEELRKRSYKALEQTEAKRNALSEKEKLIMNMGQVKALMTLLLAYNTDENFNLSEFVLSMVKELKEEVNYKPKK